MSNAPAAGAQRITLKGKWWQLWLAKEPPRRITQASFGMNLYAQSKQHVGTLGLAGALGTGCWQELGLSQHSTSRDWPGTSPNTSGTGRVWLGLAGTGWNRLRLAGAGPGLGRHWAGTGLALAGAGKDWGAIPLRTHVGTPTHCLNLHCS